MMSKKTAANTLLAILLGVVLLFTLLMALSGRSHAAPAPPPVHRVTLDHEGEPPLGDVPTKKEEPKQNDVFNDSPWLEWNRTRTLHQI